MIVFPPSATMALLRKSGKATLAKRHSRTAPRHSRGLFDASTPVGLCRQHRSVSLIMACNPWNAFVYLAIVLRRPALFAGRRTPFRVTRVAVV